MIRRSLTLRRLASTLVCVVTLAAYACSSAGASEQPGPGWELSSTTFPTNLVKGTNAISKVTTKGVPFTLGFRGSTTGSLASTATTGVVQAALEALPSIGAGNVSVSEPLAGVYEVEFIALLGSTPLGEFEPGLEAHEATVAQVHRGSASGLIAVNIFNVGAGSSSGRVTVTDVLPAGLRAKDAGELVRVGGEGFNGGWGVEPQLGHAQWLCTGNGPGVAPKLAGASVVTCTNDPSGLQSIPGGGAMPESEGPVSGLVDPRIGILVEAAEEFTGRTNRVSIVGGGALSPAAADEAVTASSHPATPGLVQWDAWLSNPDGTAATAAGSHPYEFTTLFTVPTALNAKNNGVESSEPRNLEVDLPPGLIGDLKSIPQCTREEFNGTSEDAACPATSEVGTLEASTLRVQPVAPIFNMVPRKGTPAELGFKFANGTAFLTFSVRSGGNNGIVVHADNIVQEEPVQVIATIWGVPADKSHNPWRGPTNHECSEKEMEESPLHSNEESYCTALQHPAIRPILSLPTSCETPPPFEIKIRGGWQEPGLTGELSSPFHDASHSPLTFAECESLAFGPSFQLTAGTRRADSASGLTAEVKPTLGGLEEAGSRVASEIKDATVTLPPGFAVNPEQAEGLVACSLGEASLEARPNGEENDEPAHCPEASKLGTVQVRSPLIEGAEEKQLEGNVYLLSSNPPDIKLLATAEGDGINVKLQGNAHLDEATGQIAATFTGTPQVPASLFKLTFSEAPRPALVTPVECGSYAASASFAPWSSPFLAGFDTTSGLSITEGPGGSSCPDGHLPFSPAVVAGTATVRAGQFSAFAFHLERGDGQQRVDRFSFSMPRGLAAIISNVTPCSEPQASAGTCSAASQIGHATVTAGPGRSPLVIPQPGAPEVKVYLTGPYEGAPFGLTIVTPVVAGPFNLGTIVTRARLEIDPNTAQVTVVTDPLPQIIDGVPTNIRSIDVSVDRPAFIFNPTNCTESAFAGTAVGVVPPGMTGASESAPLASRFEVGSCKELVFSPSISVRARGHGSRLNGTSLSIKVSYPKGALGKQAWVKSAKVEFPKSLPARLPTLQHACLAATFEHARTSCPAASRVGRAIARTPVLPVPLEGDVYLVSYGNAKFPDAVIVLTGDNVTVNLTGETFIDHKTGITRVTFPSTPDEPFESLEVTLPSGQFSEFGAFAGGRDPYLLCGHKLSLPTVLGGQNGLTFRKNVPITLTGCSAKKVRAKRAGGRRRGVRHR